MGTYRILDEPANGPLAHMVVQPLWPLFALMFAGNWLAMPWFCFNARAMGCPYRNRTYLLATAAMAGQFVLFIGLVTFASTGDWGPHTIRYALIIVIVWKLALGYSIYVLQSRTFELYTHFGGALKNGLFVVILGALFSQQLLNAVPEWMVLVLQ